MERLQVTLPEGYGFDDTGMARGGIHCIDGVRLWLQADQVIAQIVHGGALYDVTAGLPQVVLDEVKTADERAELRLLHERLEDQLPAPDERGVNVPERVRTRGRISGGSFAFDIPDGIPSLWGDGDRHVLWPRGEPFMLAGPQGVGKTSDLLQLALGLCGVPGFEQLYDYPITPIPAGQTVLYLALDRPQQIARNLRRMVPPQHRALLDSRLAVWAGPLPENPLTANIPDAWLAEWAQAEYGAGAIIVDSLKDLVNRLSDEEAGAQWNRVCQECVAAGIEIATAHHNRKANADNRRPKTLADVHGSENLTRGHGSIVCLFGAAGDREIEFIHLKQPAETIGPFVIERNHDSGRSRIARQGELANDAASKTGRDLRGWAMTKAVGYRFGWREVASDLGWGANKTKDALTAATLTGFLDYQPGGGAGRESTWARTALQRIPGEPAEPVGNSAPLRVGAASDGFSTGFPTGFPTGSENGSAVGS